MRNLILNNINELSPDYLITEEAISARIKIKLLLSNFIESANKNEYIDCKSVIFQLYKQFFSDSEVIQANHKKYIIFQSIIEESLGAFTSFAASEIISYQLNVISPIISRFKKYDDDFSDLLQDTIRGNILFSRICYGLNNDINSSHINVDAIKVGNNWELNGKLPPVLLAPETNMHLIFARIGGTEKISGFLVSSNLLGIHFDSKSPLSANGDFFITNMTLSEVKINENYQLKYLNTHIIDTTFLNNRVLSSFRINNRIRIILNNIKKFLRSRKSNGKPLFDIDVLQQRLAAFEAEWSTSRALTCNALVKTPTNEDYKYLVNGSKLLAIKLMLKISKEALHLGGIKHYQKGNVISDNYIESLWGSFLVESEDYLLEGIIDDIQENSFKATL